MKTVRQLKRGEWFTLRAVDQARPEQVWIRQGWDHELKKYEAVNWGDISRSRFFRPDREVFTEFTF